MLAEAGWREYHNRVERICSEGLTKYLTASRNAACGSMTAPVYVYGHSKCPSRGAAISCSIVRMPDGYSAC